MKRALFIAVLTALSISTYAQQAGIGFVVGVPQNEFRLATEAEGYGLNLTLMGKLGTKVVTFGGNINYMIYGLSIKNETLDAEIWNIVAEPFVKIPLNLELQLKFVPQ